MTATSPGTTLEALMAKKLPSKLSKPVKRVDVWKSGDRQTEIHVYLADEADTYVFGWNPKLLPSAAIVAMLEGRGFLLTPEALRKIRAA